MHELSIARSIVEIAEEAARNAGARSVEVVYVRLGAFAGVVKDALLFSFDAATDGTLLAGARLEIEEVPVAIFCEQCAKEVTLPNPLPLCCPACGTPSVQMLHGRELELTAIEVGESDATTPD